MNDDTTPPPDLEERIARLAARAEQGLSLFDDDPVEEVDHSIPDQVITDQKSGHRQNKSRFTRQRNWQRRQVARGRCMICGKGRDRYAVYCNSCGEKKARQQRERRQRKEYQS